MLSANDISEGGLFVNLIESGFVNGLGFDINLNNNMRKDAQLFGEAQGRYVVTVSTEQEAAFLAIVGAAATKLGVVNEQVTIDNIDWGTIADWNDLHSNAIEKLILKK